MTHPALPFGAARLLPLFLGAAVPAVLALVLTARSVRRRPRPPQKRPGSFAITVAALAALSCTAYSADTSWRFARNYLDMAGAVERACMFSAAELALFATALMARQTLATQGAPGLPGTLVWVITSVQVIPAYAESGVVGGTVRAFVGPVMAATMWHLAMGIELRLRTPGAASHSLLAVLGREARERLLSRLGIAARDRDAAQITRERATTRAVTLAARLAERTPEQQRSRRGRRLTRRLSKAIGRASVGTDAAQRAYLLDQLAARRHALALATVPLPSPWSATAATMPVPGGSPDSSNGDRGPVDPKGPVPAIADPKAPASAGTGGGNAGTVTGTDRPGRKVPAQGPRVYRGPADTEPGTERTGDRGPTGAVPGTAPAQEPGHKTPLQRKTATKYRTKNKGKRSRSRTPQTARPPHEPEQSVEQLVQQVLPHVPALLARDGNESVTRVQLREILRREGLPGGRNDRLSIVLQELRNADSTNPRSTR